MTKPAELRLLAALDFLQAHSDSMRRHAPFGEGREDEYARAPWWPRAPEYSWPEAYGDFAPATLKAAVRRGFVGRRGPTEHAYWITDEGRAFLRAKASTPDALKGDA